MVNTPKGEDFTMSEHRQEHVLELRHVLLDILAPVVDRMIGDAAFILVVATPTEPSEVQFTSNMRPDTQLGLMTELVEQMNIKGYGGNGQDNEDDPPTAA